MIRLLIGIIICTGTINWSFGQSLLDQYKNHPKTAIDFEIELVSDETLVVTPRNPLIIRSPNKEEVFRIYTFTKIWDNGKYKTFVGLSDEPFKPNLVTTTAGQTEIDKIQLLGNYGPNRADYEVTEEAKISSEQEITLTAIITGWALDTKGQKIKGSETSETRTTRYQISNKGKFEKIWCGVNAPATNIVHKAWRGFV
jgi:hypothetical protein